MEHLISENCERDKRNCTKITNEYWSDIILKQRAAKKAKISEEMSLVAEKYSENDPVASIDDLSVTEIIDELKKIGVKTRLKNRKNF
jgi:G:T-mismatch repair DNA endonuclease (very short patch repair protein)